MRAVHDTLPTGHLGILVAILLLYLVGTLQLFHLPHPLLLCNNKDTTTASIINSLCKIDFAWSRNRYMSEWSESRESHLPTFASVFGASDYSQLTPKSGLSDVTPCDPPKTHERETKCYNTGHWTEEEHEQFLSAVEEISTRSASKISKRIPTRSVKQVQTHGETKYIYSYRTEMQL